jgi:membrane fusion protein, adhesin transport system
MTSTSHPIAPDWLDNLSPRALTQSITLEEARLPSLFKFSVILIGAVLTAFLSWASFTHIEETASSSGQVVPSDYIQSIQHLEGGIVRQILVKDGDLVEKNAPLFRLDSTDAEADLGQMHARQKALQSQAARLRNFVNADSSAEPLSADEAAILNSMVEARASQEQVLQDQIAQKQKELVALKSTRAALEKNVSLTQQETEMHQEMARKGYGSELTALGSERNLNQIKGQLGEVISQQNRAVDAIREAQSRLTSLGADLKQDAMKTLGTVEAELAEVNKSLAKVESAANRTVITSPARGIIKGLAVHTVGAVIEPGKTLVEIVPVDKDLEVEAMISPTDIGHIKGGQPVKIKVSAYDFSRYGNVTGMLKTISASTFQTEKDQSYYKARIKLDRNYVGNDSQRNLILPGMTVQANIITGDKTVLQYLLKPLHVAADSAFHEN